MWSRGRRAIPDHGLEQRSTDLRDKTCLVRRGASRGGHCSTPTARSVTGVNAEGALQGPTLIDSIYKPGHHSDFSIRAAVRQGVQQHHWSFGDMPPVSGVSSDDVEKIICYIREMQQANGIFQRDANLSTC